MINKIRCSKGVLERLFEKSFLEFIGSGSAFESENTTAYFKEDDTLVIIDTGELNAYKINELISKSGATRVEIIITHMHMDHVGGLSTVLYYVHYMVPSITELNVIVGKGVNVKKYLEISGVTDEVFNVEKNLFEVNDGTAVLVFNGEGRYVEVYFHKNEHVPTMVSYSLLFIKRMLDRSESDKDRSIFYSGDSSNILNGYQHKLGFVDEWYQDVSNRITTAHMSTTAFVKETLWMNRPTKTFAIHNAAFKPTIELLTLERLLDIQSDTTKAFCGVEVPIDIKAEDIFVPHPGIGESDKLKEFKKICNVMPIEHFAVSKDTGYIMVKVYYNFKLIALSVIKYHKGSHRTSVDNIFTINTNPESKYVLEDFGCVEVELDHMLYGTEWSEKVIEHLHKELAVEIFKYRKTLGGK